MVNMNFQTLDEIDTFLISLKNQSVTTSGKWTLGQILSHIGDSIEFVLTQKKGAIHIPTIIQNTIGKIVLQKFFLFGKMDRGLPNPIKQGEPKDGDILVELDRVIKLSESFRNHPGPFNPHPIFGQLSKEEYIKLHLLHCSNHFSYIHFQTKHSD
jgi:hypothetical protein